MTWRKFRFLCASLHIFQGEREVLAQFLAFSPFLVVEFFFEIWVDRNGFHLFSVSLV
jgi:hypothetical protein